MLIAVHTVPAPAQDRRFANFQSLFPGASALDALEVPEGVTLFDTAGMQRPYRILCELSPDPIHVRQPDQAGNEWIEATNATAELVGGAIGISVNRSPHSDKWYESKLIRYRIHGFLRIRTGNRIEPHPFTIPTEPPASWWVNPPIDGRVTLQGDLDEMPTHPEYARSRRYRLEIDESRGTGRFTYTLYDEPGLIGRKTLGTLSVSLRVVPVK